MAPFLPTSRERPVNIHPITCDLSCQGSFLRVYAFHSWQLVFVFFLQYLSRSHVFTVHVFSCFLRFLEPVCRAVGHHCLLFCLQHTGFYERFYNWNNWIWTRASWKDVNLIYPPIEELMSKWKVRLSPHLAEVMLTDEHISINIKTQTHICFFCEDSLT